MVKRFTTFPLAMMTTIISGQSPPSLTTSRHHNLVCPLPGCGIMASGNISHTATTRLSSAVGCYIARKLIAKTRTPNEMQTKCNCIGFLCKCIVFQCKCIPSAFQMQCKCIFPLHLQCKCIKFQCKCISFYANALLLHDINEIYRFTLYISFHYIYRVGEKPPFAPKIGINFKNFEFFQKKLARFVDLSYICGELHISKAVENRKQ